MKLAKIQMEGERLIKYKLNPQGTKHIFLYKVGNLFYSFIMYKGILINDNNKEIKNTQLKGCEKVGKHAKEYFKSSLNEWWKPNNEQIFK